MGKNNKSNWHSLSVKEICKQTETQSRGLSSQEAKKRFKSYGPNELEPFKRKNPFYLFAQQLSNPLIYILLVSALVTFFLDYRIDSYVILVIVLFNAIIGVFHETRADKAMEALIKIMSLSTMVWRDGNLTSIPTRELVIGDIVEIEEGMKIPADLRIIECDNISVDEAVLTGESTSQSKIEEVLPEETILSERINILYSGTMVTAGHGKAVVVATGKNTEFGLIAKKIGQTQKALTPLQKKLAVFSNELALIGLVVVGAIFILGLIRQADPIQTFLSSLSIAVAVIPEGLPAIISITLAGGAYEMFKNKAIVRKLMAVETLGSVTVIASDKTGTLTRNQMTVEKIYFHKEEKVYSVTGSGYGPQGIISPNESENLKKMLACAALANKAEVFKEKHEWHVKGDPTEGALLTLATKAGLIKERLEKKLPLLDSQAFDSKRGFSVSLRQSSSKNILTVIGKTEEILKLCQLDPKDKKKIIKDMEEFAKDSLRVIAIAIKSVSSTRNEIVDEEFEKMDFLGFFGMRDLPREEAMEAVKACKLAGIRPIMITGDYGLTARSIAKDLGIIEDNDGQVITGEELNRLSDEEAYRVLKTCSVYARVAPEDKLKIVQMLQRKGEIVAMTGDGINDAPALKKAEVGVAMGVGGTDVSREVSDLVLADNNFATIVAAVREGRTVYKNIRRAILYLLSTNLGELFIIIVGMIFLPEPYSMVLLPVQILWLNLVTDGTAGIALALEPTHRDTLKKQPQSLKEGVVNNVMLGRILIVSFTMLVATMIIYIAEMKSGASIDRARTMAFMVMVIMQIVNVLNCRSFEKSIFASYLFSNKYILLSMIFSFALSYLTVSLPIFRTVFQTVPLSLEDWSKIVLISLSVIIIVEIEKIITKPHAKRKNKSAKS